MLLQQPDNDVAKATTLFENVVPPLSAGILECIKSSFGFREMTPVQAAVIPVFLRNKDVCVEAETGSGKTISFLIPMIEMILRREIPLRKTEVGGLVVSPTRELAMQTHAVATTLCDAVGLPKPLLLVGGSNRTVIHDLEAFHENGSDIIVATPGRLYDIMSRYEDLKFSSLECFILDEADILLDLGFSDVLSNILGKLPKMRRTGLFSATQTKAVKSLGRAGLRNPVVIRVSVVPSADTTHCETNSTSTLNHLQPTPSSLKNYYTVCPLEEKISRLMAFILQHRDEKIVVFSLTCACVDFYGSVLPKIASPTNVGYMEALHGKMVQKKREKVLERFRECSAGILFCTDVAARGLDVEKIDWVVQLDAPPDPSSFVHRVGRCARAGRLGRSLIFLTPSEDSYIEFLQLRNIPIEPLPSLERCLLPILRGQNRTGKGPEDDDIDHGIPDILPSIKSLVLQDRDILEKGTKGYTSYIRAYKEHHCSFIFRFSSLDLGLLATSFCLLRLPKMPELKPHLGKLNFTPAGPEADIYAIPYKDQVREKARQLRLAAEIEAGGKNGKRIKAERRAIERSRNAISGSKKENSANPSKKKKRGRQQQIFDEWDSLAKEERLHKKLRQGKITKEEYNRQMYGGNGSEDETESIGSDAMT